MTAPLALARRTFERDGGACAICGSPLLLSIDRLVPGRLGGVYEDLNTRTLCISCNSSRGDAGGDLAAALSEGVQYHADRARQHLQAAQFHLEAYNSFAQKLTKIIQPAVSGLVENNGPPAERRMELGYLSQLLKTINELSSAWKAANQQISRLPIPARMRERTTPEESATA